MDLGLNGSVVLITGCAGLKARAIAVAFAREGARLVGCDRDSPGTEETAAAVRDAGGTIDVVHPLDIADQGVADDWVADAHKRHGRIDVLCNCANAIHDFGTIEQSTPDGWTASMRSELLVTYMASKAVWPYFAAQRKGVILSLASASAHQEIHPLRSPAHRAAMAGVVALTRTLAGDGAPLNIRAISVSLGMFRSESTRPFWHGSDSDARGIGETLCGKIPLGRFGDCEELAKTVVFLASDAASYITATDVTVDGGLLGVSYG
jgi:NAD(P)-dependent dehydrogenase (short-subunit alcohol dehydrogenase family)